jgi:hypothetical protein
MRVLLFRKIITAVVALTVLISGALSPGSTSAAQTSQVGAGNALKVSPVRLDVKMDPGTTQTISVFIQNLTNAQALLHPVINDFVASSDETGRPNVILNEDEYAPSHSLKRLITPLKDLTVAPGETREVKVTITAKKDTAGGGYFGAVRFAPANAEGDRSVNLAASVGTLVLLRVNGDIKEDLTVESFDARKGDGGASIFFMNGQDLKGVVRFKNSGNIHLEPFGTVRLKRFGKVLGSYEINNGELRGNVLPDSIRRFDVALDKVGSWGKYTLEGNFGYGSTGQLLTATYTFYVVPVALIAIGVGLLLVLLFLIFVLPRMMRAYNRRVIRRANRRR